VPERTSRRNLEPEYGGLGIDPQQGALVFKRLYALGMIVWAVTISAVGSISALCTGQLFLGFSQMDVARQRKP
jgi:hypothetical protein